MNTTPRTVVRVQFDNGQEITTGINATPAEARAYFLGHVFNLGDGQGGDRSAQAVAVLVLHTEERPEGAQP